MAVFPRTGAFWSRGRPGPARQRWRCSSSRPALTAARRVCSSAPSRRSTNSPTPSSPTPYLADENLTVATIHAEPGESVGGDDGLVVRALESGDCTAVEWFDLPFTRRNVVEYLGEFAPADRVAVDSVSGIRPMADGRVRFWRSVYDLIRLFGDDSGATSVLTAGDAEASAVATDLVRYATHGAVDLE